MTRETAHRTCRHGARLRVDGARGVPWRCDRHATARRAVASGVKDACRWWQTEQSGRVANAWGPYSCVGREAPRLDAPFLIGDNHARRCQLVRRTARCARQLGPFARASRLKPKSALESWRAAHICALLLSCTARAARACPTSRRLGTSTGSAADSWVWAAACCAARRRRGDALWSKGPTHLLPNADCQGTRGGGARCALPCRGGQRVGFVAFPRTCAAGGAAAPR